MDLLKTSYNLFSKQDYPSPGFLKKILIDEQVSPIFAINQNKSEVFKQFEVNFVTVFAPCSSAVSGYEEIFHITVVILPCYRGSIHKTALGSRTMTTTSSRVRDFLNAN